MQKILIINLGGIGDILLSTPALRALKSSFPEVRIYLLVFPHVLGTVSDLPYIAKIFCFHRSKKRFFENLRVLFKLRAEKFDAAINMRTLVSERGAKKINFLLDSINPKIKGGRDTEGRGYFFDIKIPESDVGQKHEMEYDIDTVKALGVEAVDKNIHFKIDDTSSEKVNEILKNKGMYKEDIVIGIHPGGMPSRRWPIENFSKIIEQISQKIYCKFVITGRKDEVNLVKRLENITKIQIMNLSDKINLRELSALIKRCNLFITNDTGPMHIAAILKTPLIAIFGPGDIIRYDPRNISDKVIVLYKKTDCAPCNKVKCDSMECLKAIFPEEVAQAALHLMQQNY